MIRHVLFDLGNVLVPVNWDRAFTRLVPHLPPDLADLCRKNRPGFEDLFTESAAALETGKIEFDEFHHMMLGVLRIDLDEEEFRDIFCRIFSLDQDMVELGEILSRRYGAWLVSNTSRVHYDYIVKTFPQVQFYRDAALSFEIGYVKPSPAYYEKAVQKFAIDPASAVFVDDLPENVDGAIRAGMTGIVFRNRTQLVHQLKSLGIEVPGAKE